MTKVVIDQKAYLKKYLKSNKDVKKNKKKKIKVGAPSVKIIDDDIDLHQICPMNHDELEIFNVTEDAPQIVGIIDERGPVDFADRKRWKIIADDGEGNLSIEANSRDVGGKVKAHSSGDRILSEPVKARKNDQENGNIGKISSKKSRKPSDDDLSPPRKSKDKKKSTSSEASYLSSSDSSSKSSEGNSKRKRKPTKSSKNRRKSDDDSDLSLPRPRKGTDSDDFSPPRRKNLNKSNIDMDPPRKSRRDNVKNSRMDRDSDSDSSPRRKCRREDTKNFKRNRSSDSDLSPPRKSQRDSRNVRKRKDDDSDLSPRRKCKRKDTKNFKKNRSSDSDLSPPRKSQRDSRNVRKRRDDDSDLSPRRKCKRKDTKNLKKNRSSDSDLSPPRKSQRESRNVRKRRDDDSDLSPPRKSKREDTKNLKRNRSSDSDLSPPRKSQRDSRNVRKRRDDDSDLSPPRKSRREDTRRNRRDKRSSSDLNSPRKSDKSDSRAFKRNRNNDSDLNYRKNDSISERFKPEPSNSQEQFKRKTSRSNGDERRSPTPEKRMKKTLDGKNAGLQNAETLREEVLSHKRREKDLFNQISAEVSGKGQATMYRKTGKRYDLEVKAAQKREKDKQQAEIDEKHSKWGKGLKQVSDREQKLQDDLYEMSKPLARYADDADLAAHRRAIEYEGADVMLAYVKEKQIMSGNRQPDAPIYQGSFLPNRFGIRPGCRWDGVDRSNGYEKKWFEARNAKAAIEEEAYKWSTADM